MTMHADTCLDHRNKSIKLQTGILNKAKRSTKRFSTKNVDWTNFELINKNYFPAWIGMIKMVHSSAEVDWATDLITDHWSRMTSKGHVSYASLLQEDKAKGHLVDPWIDSFKKDCKTIEKSKSTPSLPYEQASNSRVLVQAGYCKSMSKKEILAK